MTSGTLSQMDLLFTCETDGPATVLATYCMKEAWDTIKNSGPGCRGCIIRHIDWYKMSLSTLSIGFQYVSSICPIMIKGLSVPPIPLFLERDSALYDVTKVVQLCIVCVCLPLFLVPSKYVEFTTKHHLNQTDKSEGFCRRLWTAW